jgi:1,4-alpha-glucan branching enzyme
MSLKKQYLKSRNLCKVTFRLSKPEAQGAGVAHLVGDFNDWDVSATPMKRLKSGEFTTTVPLESGKAYQFRYLLDQSSWQNDGNADAYVPSGVSADDNSVVVI